jgi:hypothetical protein
MRLAGLILWSLLSAGCILDGGRHGEPVWRERPLQTYVQMRVAATLVVETGNPELPPLRYAYSSLESFDTTAVTLPLHLALGTGNRQEIRRGGPDDRRLLAPRPGDRARLFPYESERALALANAKSDALARVGTCAQLIDATVNREGNLYQPRSAHVTTSAGIELTEEQLAGLCTGGAIP